jgi:hypothetical protein
MAQNWPVWRVNPLDCKLLEPLTAASTSTLERAVESRSDHPPSIPRFAWP